MNYTVNYIPDKNIVSVKNKGRLNFQIAEKYSTEAVKEARQNDCSRFLFDHSETILKEGVNQIHANGDELQQFGFKDTDRIAIITADQGDDSNLIENVNQNTKWSQLKYFYSDQYDEAINWLLEVEI